MPSIRAERPSDHDAVHTLNVHAFGRSAEAELVDALRDQAKPLVSLVAIDSVHVMGHIMFSPVTLVNQPNVRLMGLAPMAVAPEHQRQGIGSALVEAGLAQCRQLGYGGVVVLGHPTYYPRFGFVPAMRFGIDSEYEVPPETFMAMELVSGHLSNRPGTIRYHTAFGAV